MFIKQPLALPGSANTYISLIDIRKVTLIMTQCVLLTAAQPSSCGQQAVAGQGRAAYIVVIYGFPLLSNIILAGYDGSIVSIYSYIYDNFVKSIMFSDPSYLNTNEKPTDQKKKYTFCLLL